VSAAPIFATYNDLGLDQLLAVIRERLADVADRFHLGPVPGDLGPDLAADLLADCAEQQVPDYLASAHRQLGYAARELRTVVRCMGRGDARVARAFACSVALYLDQAEAERASAELQNVDPPDRIAADLDSIRQHVLQPLAPALGWSNVPTGPYILETAGKTVVRLRDGYTVAEAEAPEIAPGRCHTIRQHLANAGELLASAYFNPSAGVPAAAGEIADRIRLAAELVGASARLQQPTDQHGGTPA
jgi:hypothetical protein